MTNNRVLSVDKTTLLPPTNVIEAWLPIFSGGGGGSGEVHRVTEAQSTWSITHFLGRLPSVTIYSDAGEEIESDVSSTNTQVVITFPSPHTGAVVLT